MKGHDKKIGVPQSIEIDVNIEELENRGWPRPRSVNSYKIEKESVTKILASAVPRGPAHSLQRLDAEHGDRQAA